MTRLLLVRHGQSEWNAVGRWQGQVDIPLTELGRRQARAAAESVGAFDLIASSDLERAQETAEILAAPAGIGPVITDPRLRERNAGVWQGMTKAEIAVEYPGWLEDGRRPDDYESDESLLSRAVGALASLAAQVPGGTALAVVHAGVIYAVEELAGERFERIPNLGGRWITLAEQELSIGERVELVDPDRVESTTPDAI